MRGVFFNQLIEVDKNIEFIELIMNENSIIRGMILLKGIIKEQLNYLLKKD